MTSRRRRGRLGGERSLTVGVPAHGKSPAGDVEITLPLKRLDELDPSARAAIARDIGALLIRRLRARLAAHPRVECRQAD
jgi:hypothetical protein